MDRYLCLRVADAVREQIAAGYLRPGDRVPSRRELAGIHGAHIYTVAHGLQILEQEGLVWRCPGLGYYVSAHQSRTNQPTRVASHPTDA